MGIKSQKYLPKLQTCPTYRYDCLLMFSIYYIVISLHLHITFYDIIIIAQNVNLANNKIEVIPTTWTDAWGAYDADSGVLSLGASSSKGVEVTLVGNPILP